MKASLKTKTMSFKMLSIYSAIFIIMSATVVRATDRDSDRCPRPDEIAPCQCRTRGPTIQVRCTNSMMGRITEAMMNIRKRVDVVDVLILEGNNIPHLPSRAFGSVQVNRLFIENNRISTIDRNAFAGVENFITEIYIKEPGLRVLPADSIEFLRNLKVFSLENSQISDMPTVSGLRDLQLFRIDGSDIRNIPGSTFRHLPSLRYLHIAQSKLARLDIGVLENLHQLQLANFTSNEITWIHPRAFRYMEQMKELVLRGNRLRDAAMVGRSVRVIKTLRKLDLGHNDVAELDAASFMDVISLEELDLSYNSLTELRKMALHRLPRLRVVNLSHNKIRSFHSDAFKDTPMVETLFLSHNDLSRITDVSFIMDSLPKLSLLDLSDNYIRDIPFGALRGYPRLERLHLANNQISHVSREAFADLPGLVDLDLSKNKLIADALDGPIFDLSHLRHLNLSFNKLSLLDDKVLSNLHHLESLDVSHNGIMKIDETALQTMRMLRLLNISNNNIRELEPNTFQSLVKLTLLDASHNELIALPDGLLRSQRSLEEVSFAYNQIQLVSSRLFTNTNKIKHLDFTSNYILSFPDDLVSSLQALRKLKFRRNSVQRLTKHSFRGLRNLELIDMHDNRIEEIEEDAFSDLSSLTNLDLSLNIISTVGDSLEPLSSLVKLNLSDNYITSLPRNAFHALRRLSTLDVSNNTIVQIGRAFIDMPELKYLDLSYNHLPVIKEGSFKSLPSLISLHLNHNSIIELQSDAFQDLWNLEEIVLTKNGIPRIQKDTFRDLPSLEILRLDDNLIKELETRSFVDLFSLKELHLQHNLLEEFNDRAFVRIPSLRHLNVSYNLIRDLARPGFVGLETLETIDLSFNDIREVDERAFEELRWLAILKLNDNNICEIQDNAFRNSPSLRSLSLHNNRLTRIPEESFGETRHHIARFNVAGNPLSCDCEALWLRNWVSHDDNIVDEPRCYFPKSLSGNPLRQLRSSRFTCDPRSRSSFIDDACDGIPLKTPPQEAVREAASKPVYHYPVVETIQTTEGTRTPSQNYKRPPSPTASATTTTTPATEKPSLFNDIVDKLDEDAVVIDDELANDDQSEYYEYYYVYYDENGNIVGNVTTPVVETEALVENNKVQEIVLESAETPAETPKGDKVTGDTPTIYAEIQDDKDEAEKSEEEDDRLTIFGIPIPKLPISLNFGLAPVLSQGLLPLPIGRKGDNGEDLIAQPSNHKAHLPESGDQTRGPDFLDPVLVETGLKAASKLWPHIKASFASKNNKKEAKDEEKAHKSDSVVKKKHLHNMYSYQHPTNPLIPLRPSHQGKDGHTVNRQGEYFPKGFIPAIKFDHPIRDSSILSGGSPVLPPPRKEERDRVKKQSSNRYNPFPGLGIRKGQPKEDLGSPQHSVNGFIPLFRPHAEDNLRNGQKHQQFYGVHKLSQYTGSASVPGENRPFQPTTESEFYNVPTNKRKPSIRFTSPANELDSTTSSSSTSSSTTNEDILENEREKSSSVGPSYEAVPSSESQTVPVISVADPSQVAPTMNSPAQTTLEDIFASENDFYEYYENFPGSPEVNADDAMTTKDELEKLLEDLRRQREIAASQSSSSSSSSPSPDLNAVQDDATSQDETSSTASSSLENVTTATTKEEAEEEKGDNDAVRHEQTVPTLLVEEVTSTTPIVPSSGQSESSEAENATATAYTEVTTEAEEIPSSTLPQYEYEYVYEYYYDDYNDTDVDGKSVGTTALEQPSQSSDDEGGGGFATLTDLFSMLSGGEDESAKSSDITNEENVSPHVANRPVTFSSILPSSTQGYERDDNFLESHRSVTADSIGPSNIKYPDRPLVASSTESKVSPSRSSPYPFHPDNLDPRTRYGESDLENEWYYSNQDLGRFKGSGLDGTDLEGLMTSTTVSATTDSSSERSLISLSTLCVSYMFAQIFLHIY